MSDEGRVLLGCGRWVLNLLLALFMAWAAPHLNPIKQDAGNEHQISDKQDQETALDMWDCEMRVMNDGSDNGYNNRDEEGDLSRCGELHCVFPLQSPSLGRAILSFCCLGKKQNCAATPLVCWRAA